MRTARCRCRDTRRRPRRGVLLLVVLVVVALMTIANLSYFDWTLAERKAADASTRSEQALAAAESAVEMLRVYLSQETAAIDQDGGWYDNPARFRGVLIADGPAAELRARAAAVAPRWGREALEGGRFGLEDDSGRLNLNTVLVTEARQEGAGKAQLMALPGMTDAIADAILDWIDEDDQTRTLGAERDYYASLDPPYLPANGSFSAIEQLLLVKGVTPELLWGVDQDRNHQASATEVASVPLPVDNTNGSLNGGWATMLTLHSAELNYQPDGTPKVNLNGEDLQTLHENLQDQLGLDAANFIIAYRQGGPEDEESPEETDGEPSDEATSDDDQAGPPGGVGLETVACESVSIDFDTPGPTELTDPLELVGVTVRVVEKGQLSPVLIESPWQEDDGSLAAGLADLMRVATTTEETSIPGRVNINQAPRAVLAGLPNLPPNVIDAILAGRDPAAGWTRPDRQHATWLLTEGYVDLATMKDLAPYVTGQGGVFRTQVIGGFESGGPTRRLEVVLDTTNLPPRIAVRRDLSPLGAGFDPAIALVPEELATPRP